MMTLRQHMLQQPLVVVLNKPKQTKTALAVFFFFASTIEWWLTVVGYTGYRPLPFFGFFMSTIYFWSDLHLGHANIPRFRPQFASERDHFEYVKAQWKATINKRDKVFILGDCCFTHEALAEFNAWPGRKVLIMGNHDTDRKLSMQDLLYCYDEIHSLYKHREFWLSHAPIHQDELRGKINIHGHTHYHCIDDKRYVNVCIEQQPKPISIDCLRALIT